MDESDAEKQKAEFTGCCGKCGEPIWRDDILHHDWRCKIRQEYEASLLQ